MGEATLDWWLLLSPAKPLLIKKGFLQLGVCSYKHLFLGLYK